MPSEMILLIFLFKLNYV